MLCATRFNRAALAARARVWIAATVALLASVAVSGCAPDSAPVVSSRRAAAASGDGGSCLGVGYAGCCVGVSTLRYCAGGQLVTRSCAPGQCGWSATFGLYGCGSSAAVDPTGQSPRACGAATDGGVGDAARADGAEADGSTRDGSSASSDASGADGATSRCAGIGYVGCCTPSGTLRFCAGGQLLAETCAAGTCGWNAARGYYGCGTAGGADPSATHPRACRALAGDAGLPDAPQLDGRSLADVRSDVAAGDTTPARDGAPVDAARDLTLADAPTLRDAGASDLRGLDALGFDGSRPEAGLPRVGGGGGCGCAASPGGRGEGGAVTTALALALLLALAWGQRRRRRRRRRRASSGRASSGRASPAGRARGATGRGTSSGSTLLVLAFAVVGVATATGAARADAGAADAAVDAAADATASDAAASDAATRDARAQDTASAGSGCGAVPAVGCCEGERLLWCEGGKLRALSCVGRASCGYVPARGIYDCNTAGSTDPSGATARDCLFGDAGAPRVDAAAAPNGCGGVSAEGCCAGELLRFCVGGQLREVDCRRNLKCGWQPVGLFYDCGTLGAVDPAGAHVKACAGPVPDLGPDPLADAALPDASDGGDGAAGGDGGAGDGAFSDSGGGADDGGGCGCGAAPRGAGARQLPGGLGWIAIALALALLVTRRVRRHARRWRRCSEALPVCDTAAAAPRRQDHRQYAPSAVAEQALDRGS